MPSVGSMNELGREDLSYLREGGTEGLDRFYRRHAGRVLGWAIRLGDPRLDPEDIAQEVFAIALKRMDTFRGDSSVNSWLFGITRNVVANQRRKAFLRRLVGLKPGNDLHSKERPADEALEFKRRRKVVQKALNSLNRKQREVLVLVDLEGASAAEAGAMLSIPTGTVYSRLHHGRRAFAKALKGLGIDRDPSKIGSRSVLADRGRYQ